uniref:Uncharacterized protein n=1 Tax=Arundo donax TaxID=35708 RepID=A0A0A9HD91_ARUDO
MGHVGRSRSHRSTQRWWKACAHSGSTRSTSPLAYSPRHTAQHVDAAIAVSLVAAASPYTSLGSALSVASSSPASASTKTTVAVAVRRPRSSRGAALREHARRRKATVATARTLATAKATSSSTIRVAGRRRCRDARRLRSSELSGDAGLEFHCVLRMWCGVMTLISGCLCGRGCIAAGTWSPPRCPGRSNRVTVMWRSSD